MEPSREVAAAGAMRPGRLEKLLVAEPQTSCLPVVTAIHPIPPILPVRTKLSIAATALILNRSFITSAIGHITPSLAVGFNAIRLGMRVG